MSQHGSATAREAADILVAGGLVLYPTEGVWGLGCDPRNPAAVRRLLQIKQRPVEKGLILIAADEAQLASFIDMARLDAEQQAAVRASWPGANTWIVPASANAPDWIRGAHSGIAVRVCAQAEVIALCRAFGGALVSTSANFSGQVAPTSRAELDPVLVAEVDAVLAGETGGRKTPSSIRDAASGQILRSPG
ncbi:tRNA threonylcarbamoyladenosine biosynthesis protein RimN [Lysobacteraceae bacterium NML08-0793]|nr:tRNA threonylcarbamoyladenosine biosynthesis protein RimN [Xanthomonadaceae bacterium NML08-0793]